MAFHFNWSPLIADTDRVRQMLTASLNKSPKPPIIVDDIVVNELNLGSNPPSLEILEVGDLAEDRFRGIFKVRYEGDAYLTLKTRVQANPLNTFLSTKPGFASPTPLAAGSGLTIPLQITLSDIRLSGFVILVFSKQKGITLVFRNDPLESLKVSSTFDSIPFVREYLQRTIEGQLRVLFMEDLPAIIHRLSLRVFNAEHQDAENAEVKKIEQDSQQPVDPFANPSQSEADDDGIATPSFFDIQGGTYASFSQKNVLRLAALTESQRTLSLFTPSIRDAVHRAWAGPSERNSPNDGMDTPFMQRPATLSRIQSTLNMSSVPTLSSAASFASETPSAPSHASRPSLASLPSASTTTYSFTSTGSRARPHGARKRKHRVVNLRRNTDGADDGTSDTMSILSSSYDDSASRSEGVSGDASTGLISPEVSTVPTSVHATSIHPREREGEVHTPETSPKKRAGKSRATRSDLAEDVVAGAEANATLRAMPHTPRHRRGVLAMDDNDPTPRASMYLPPERAEAQEIRASHQAQESRTQNFPTSQPKQPIGLPRSASELSISDLVSAFPAQGGSSGGILEQAWMMKMASEIAKRVAEEKGKQSDWQPQPSSAGSAKEAIWGQPQHEGSEEDLPPPAYVS